jgi:hypothetical protein
LFLYDVCWRDCEGLLKHPLDNAVAHQRIRSVGSISANIEEGYGRGFGKDRVISYAFRLAPHAKAKDGTVVRSLYFHLKCSTIG